MTREFPPNASVANPAGGDRLHAPAADRNAAALADLVARHGPAKGRALEIASGTGQHIPVFATALPDVTWQPSDIEPARLRSIDSYARDAGLGNIAPAVLLDATAPGWAFDHAPQDLIVLVNLLHLITDAAARTLISEAARALRADGTLIVYGPFKRQGALTSDGDVRFDADLRAADPDIGYKDTLDIGGWFGDAGLTFTSHDMPANNLALVARKHRP